MFTNVSIRNVISICATAMLLFVTVVDVKRLEAQATAAISGTVMDSSGAAIGGAAVQAKNTGTSLTQTATSDELGRFRFPDLAIGGYEVQASTPGFQTIVHKDITLTVGSNPVVDFRLPVGET